MGIGENVGENTGSNTGSSGYKEPPATGGGTEPAVYSRFVTFEDTLDGSVVGTSCVDSFQVNGDPNNFDSSGALGQTLCLYDNTHVYNPAGLSNARSAKMTGSGGTLGGEPGTFVDNPGTSGSDLPIGTEIWYQLRMYPNSEYVTTLNSLDLGMKFVRGNSTNNFWGFYPYEINRAGRPANHFMKFDTGGVTERAVMQAPTATANGQMQANQWNTYEIYMKVGNTTSNSELRFWKDHQPCTGYYVTFPGPVFTLNTDGGGYSFLIPVVGAGGSIKSYWRSQGTWNNYLTPTITAWWDSIATVHNAPAGSTQPAKTDSNGFPYIGDWENG